MTRPTPHFIAGQIANKFDADYGDGLDYADFDALVTLIAAAIEADRASVASTPDVIPDRIAGSQDGIGNVGEPG